MLTSSVAKSQDRRPASLTSSLELIVSFGGGSKAKAISKVLIASFLGRRRDCGVEGS